MLAMVLTHATFHLEMSALNADLKANSLAMLPTAAVFQTPIGPYVLAAAVGLVSQFATAVLMLVSVRASWPLAGSARRSSASVVVNGIGRKEEGV
jgi:hypothetical protein